MDADYKCVCVSINLNREFCLGLTARTAGWGGRRRRRRYGRRTTVKEAVVDTPIADERKVFPKPSLANHRTSVAADEHGFVLLETMVVVEVVGVRGVGDAAVVDGVLTVVLAEGLEDARRELEETVGDGVKLGFTEKFFEFRIADFDFVAREHARVGETGGLAESLKVFDVHGAAEALAEKNFVRTQILWESSVAVDVGKVKLPTVGEHAIGLAQHCGFIRAEIDDAVADDHIHRVILDSRRLQILNRTLLKPHVWHRVPQRLGAVLIHVLPRHLQLSIRHVHTNHGSFFTHQARSNVTISSASAPQIQHPQPFNPRRCRAPTPVVLCLDLIRDILERFTHALWDLIRRGATCRRFQVIRVGQRFPVVLLHRCLHRVVPTRGEDFRPEQGIQRGRRR